MMLLSVLASTLRRGKVAKPIHKYSRAHRDTVIHEEEEEEALCRTAAVPLPCILSRRVGPELGGGARAGGWGPSWGVVLRCC